jgi:hypothetical protein
MVMGDNDSENARIGGVEGQRREEDFLFGSVSAAKYQEFAVIKINKRGKRQFRVLGIDGNNIYNIKSASVKDDTTAQTFSQSNLATLQGLGSMN